MRGLPRVAWVYVSAVVVLAAGTIGLSFSEPPDWPTLVVLLLLFVVCESTPALLFITRARVSLSFAAGLASVVLLGPVGAAIVGLGAALTIRPDVGIVKRFYNGAQYALAGYAAGVVYSGLGGIAGVPKPEYFPAIIGPFVVSVFAYQAVNLLLVGGILALTKQLPAQRMRWRPTSQLVISYFGYGMFGLLIAALWRAIGPFSAVLVLIPTFVARWAFAQSRAQQQAYAATLATLCQAVETKDYYTRGHSERVSRGSAMIAREIGMRSERVEAIRYAGMLHDVGKLGVSTKVLQKSGALTEEEYAAIQLHPMRGLEIVREIGFLDEALAGIMHHHERMDGRGYPMGLAGEEIPEFARLISVADAFDSMTSTRSYRDARSIEEAVAELRRCAGSHFDPVVVDVFLRSLDEEGWTPPRTTTPPGDEEVETACQDHDDLSAPLRIANEGMR